MGLRVVNQFLAKDLILDAEFHFKLNHANPIRIVGFNPDIEGAMPAADLGDLREHYRKYRYYVHTSRALYEDGYNLALLEAMAVGMPVVTNAHPSSPIENGVHGFKSDSIEELTQGIRQLQRDPDLARSMGALGRQLVLDRHGFDPFNAKWLDAIRAAIQSY